MRSSDPLRWLVYGITLDRWLLALAVLTAVIGAFYVVRGLLLSQFERFAARTSTGLDDHAVHVVQRTRFFAVFAVALASASYVLGLPADHRVHRLLNAVATVAVAVQVALWGSAFVTFALARYARRQEAANGTTNGATATTLTALGYIMRGLLWLVILLVALGTLGVNVTALVTGLGVGGIAIALAVQNILGDLFGALSIVLDKPFVVGDTIAVDQFTGTVEHIGLKTTRLRAQSGEQLVFSNADLLRSRIRNFNRQTSRRVQFNFIVAPDTTAEAAEAIPGIVRATIEGLTNPAVRFERAHFVRPIEAGLEFEVVYHVPTADYSLYLDAQQRLNLTLLTRFREMGVTFSAGTRTVILRGDGDPLREGRGGSGDEGGAPPGEPAPDGERVDRGPRAAERPGGGGEREGGALPRAAAGRTT